MDGVVVLIGDYNRPLDHENTISYTITIAISNAKVQTCP